MGRQYFDFMAELQTAIAEACSTGKESTQLYIIKRQAEKWNLVESKL